MFRPAGTTACMQAGISISSAFEEIVMYGKKGRIGLAVLDSDLCIEPDLRRVLPEGVEIHTARVIYPHEVSPEAMEIATSGLDQAVKSLLAVQPRSIVWAC